MQHQYDFEAVSRTLNDICGMDNHNAFGGIPILLGGDFAQTLPVVRRGNRAQTVAASIKNSQLWQSFKVLQLTKNMRIRDGIENEAFSLWLSQMSYQMDKLGHIQLPSFINQLVDTGIQQFCDFVFPHELLETASLDTTVLQSRAILTMRNVSVNDFNSFLLQQMRGEIYTFNAINTTDSDDPVRGINPLPAEYLQSLETAGLPPSQLLLKKGAPVMLLRNLYPKQGLCNGTRLTIEGKYLKSQDLSILIFHT